MLCLRKVYIIKLVGKFWRGPVGSIVAVQEEGGVAADGALRMREEDLNKRLESERKFQNQRTLSTAQGEKEPRSRFYYLSDNAYKHYHQTLEDIAGKRVVVIGCEMGGVTPLARKGAIVIGVDIADEAVKMLNGAIAREGLSENAQALVMNGEDLELPANSVDVVCCTGVLHHLDVEKAARSWARTLALGGRVTMIEPMAWHPIVALYRVLTPSMRTPDEHPLTPKDMRVLRRYFGEVKIHGYVLTSVLSVIGTYFPNGQSITSGSCKLLERVDQFLLKYLPFLAYFCWTCVIELREPLYTDSTKS